MNVCCMKWHPGWNCLMISIDSGGESRTVEARRENCGRVCRNWNRAIRRAWRTLLEWLPPVESPSSVVKRKKTCFVQHRALSASLDQHHGFCLSNNMHDLPHLWLAVDQQQQQLDEDVSLRMYNFLGIYSRFGACILGSRSCVWLFLPPLFLLLLLLPLACSSFLGHSLGSRVRFN